MASYYGAQWAGERKTVVSALDAGEYRADVVRVSGEIVKPRVNT